MMGRQMTDWLDTEMEKLAKGEELDPIWFKTTRFERFRSRIIKWFCERYCY